MFDAAVFVKLHQVYRDKASSSRSIHNKKYMLDALKAIGFDPRFKWLGLENEKAFREGVAKPQWTVLAELGRFKNPGLIQIAAADLCRNPPQTATEAIRQLRETRINRRALGSPEALANKLHAVMNKYLEEHPELSKRDIMSAIASLSIFYPS